MLHTSAANVVLVLERRKDYGATFVLRQANSVRSPTTYAISAGGDVIT
jgi:hypothetical protein